MFSRSTALASVSVAALALLGCASAPPYEPAANPYAAAAYTGAPQMGSGAILVGETPPPQYSANGTPFELVAYEGIDGARRAHRLYTEEEAKKLSGRCERFVKPVEGESPADIANLCNIPLERLVTYNPDLKNVSYADQSVVIEIPGGTIERNGIDALIDQVADLYQVQDGDTLNKISDDLGVPPAMLVNLNPEVSWSTLAPGQVLRRPSSAVVPAPSAPSSGYASTSGEWSGYKGYGVGSYGGSGVYGSGNLAPYALGPVAYQRNREPADVIEGVAVDKPFVKAGDSVRLTVKTRPNSNVTFYSGETTDDMREVATARSGADGVASTDVRVKKGGKGSSAGGVIFKAQPDKGEAKYSDRVGVITVKPDRDDHDGGHHGKDRDKD